MEKKTVRKQKIGTEQTGYSILDVFFNICVRIRCISYDLFAFCLVN